VEALAEEIRKSMAGNYLLLADTIDGKGKGRCPLEKGMRRGEKDSRARDETESAFPKGLGLRHRKKRERPTRTT
jgi:hypothetical protein